MRSPFRIFLLFWMGLSWLVACKDGSAPTATSSSAQAILPQTSVAAPGPSATAAASAEPSARMAEESPPVGDGVLFRISSKQPGVLPSHMLGTMHTGIDAEKQLPRAVFEELDKSRLLIVEVDALDIDPFEALKLAQLPPGQSIAEKLSPGRWDLLVERVGGLLMPESSLRTFKPWFLVALITQDMLEKTDPMDLVLHRRAKDKRILVLPLETIPEQLKIIDGALDVRALDDMLGELPKVEALTKQLATAYAKGDLRTLEEIAFDPVEMKKHPKQFDDMLFARNRRWLPKLKRELDKGSVFVAVGAAHLLGAEGLVAQLKALGFEVERVTGAPKAMPAPPPQQLP